MFKDYYKLKTIDNVVLPAKIQTELALDSLDFIPGSTIYGLMAGSLYDEGNPIQTLDLFHNGSVRFLDGRLYHQSLGEAMAIPRNLFYEKDDPEKSSCFPQSEIYREGIRSGKIYEQYKKGNFFYKDKEFFRATVKTAIDFKTAIDYDSKTALDEQLFLYKSIARGQEFLIKVTAENESYLNLIKEKLSDRTARIGRSKTAEYSRVHFTWLRRKEMSSIEKNGDLKVFLASRTTFVDEYGNFSLNPGIEDFGFSSGEIDWSSSFIRTSSYAPFNSKRNTREWERPHFAPGSIITLRNAKKQFKDIEFFGLGVLKNEGFGEALINPPFLEKTGIFKIQQALSHSFPVGAPTPSSTLAKLLLDREHHFHTIEIMEKDAMDFKLGGIPNTQWKNILDWSPASENVTSDLESFLKEGYKKNHWSDKAKILCRELENKTHDQLSYLRVIAKIKIRESKEANHESN